MSAIGEEILQRLFALRDEQYKGFTLSLMPGVDEEKMIGVRGPQLRALAKEMSKRADAADFLKELPHRYHEENLIHCRLLEGIRDYEELMAELERFLPFVDNWAVCDSLNPKRLRRHLPELLPQLRIWLDSEHCYTVRFAIGMLLRYYLEQDTFSPMYLSWVAQLHRREYYIRMMQAWFFAEALAKQYEAVLPLLEGYLLPAWIHNKVIQKAVESRRIPEQRKTQLKLLRIRRK